jgi:chemotaxis family two-component system sensor kinase Cph1
MFPLGKVPAAVLPPEEACAREPIHVIAAVQSHGWLFALSEPDLTIRQVSANVSSLVGIAPDLLVGKSFASVIGERQFGIFRSYVLMTDDLLAANPLRMLAGNSLVETNCVAHRHDGVLIAELERSAGAHTLEPLNFAAHISAPLSRMEQASDIADLARAAANETRTLSGFDRVMVYRFDEQWNGEVIAESTGKTDVSYLGLRFPASDIPAQARRLFLLNRLRAIADIDSTPVPIVPEIGPPTNRPLDLTHSFLRSASPVHIEYLRNMRVRSSMTVSVIVQGRLWGMIACHDSARHQVDRLTRSVCELIGRILASQVMLRIENALLQSRLDSRNRLEAYMADIEASTSLFRTQPFEGVRLRELLDADGLVSCINGVVTCEGTTVDEAVLRPIVGKLRAFASRGIASSNRLGILDHDAESYARAVSGALYLGLAEGSNEYLLLVRRELVETVSWAGNPDKAVNADADGTLRPRTSFAAWKETMRGRTRPWTELELESARILREQLLRLRDGRTTSG